MTGVNLTLLVQNAHFFAGRRRVKIVLSFFQFLRTFLSSLPNDSSTTDFEKRLRYFQIFNGEPGPLD